jgi:hypothetical protein
MVEFRFKLLFFDTKEIRSKLSEATRKVMSKFGAFVRATARQSIKTKPTSSAPGQPPHSHTGYLKKGILFGYDERQQSVVVGPVKLPKKGNAPEALEKGGEAVKRRNPRRKDHKIGDRGIMLLRKTNSPASKQVKDWSNRPRWVTFGPIRTARQVTHAEKLETVIWGPKMISGSLRARPYMGPAFEKELPNLPPNWRDSVK